MSERQLVRFPQKGPRPKPNEERFWAKVEKGDSCWIFTGGKSKWVHRNGTAYGGYGTFGVHEPGITGHRRGYAHRFAWELAHGPVPTGMDVLHHCDNPPCVKTEPDDQFPEGHLFLGTARDNGRDMTQKNRAGRPWARLTPEQVREIRAASGLQREIASRYGIQRQAVGKIQHRRTWKHLP